MSRFCNKCGQVVDGSQKFCSHCGNALKSSHELQQNISIYERAFRKIKSKKAFVIGTILLGVVCYNYYIDCKTITSINLSDNNEIAAAVINDKNSSNKKVNSTNNSNAEHIGGKSDFPNNESASTVTEDNKFSYVKKVIKDYLKRDVFLVSARQKVDKGVNITSYEVKENEKKYESFVTTYEKDGVIWQIVSRDLGGFVVWCREEKVYRSVAFLPNQDGSTNHSYDRYLENALDLASGRKIVHPLADD